MQKLLEIIKEAKAFSEIYPELKCWKKSIESHFAFVDFDAMCDGCELFDDEVFRHAVSVVRKWRTETNKNFQVNHENKNQEFQVDFAFPVAPPLQHIVEAENRMLIVCLLQALKGFNEQQLYKEFEFYKKAHERHWTIKGLTQTYKWAVCDNKQLTLSDELKSENKGALSFI